MEHGVHGPPGPHVVAIASDQGLDPVTTLLLQMEVLTV